MFTDKLKTLDRKIGPALSRITWNHKGIVDFCRDARKVCSSTQGLTDSFKEYTASIVRCTREMSNLPLIFMKHKHLYNAEEFENAQRKHRNQTVQTLSHLADDIKGSLKGLFRLFAGDNAESIREWDRYIMGVDKNIEKALSDASKKSLQEMSRVINADNASESQAPLFSVRVTLDTQNRVIYTPSPAELMQLINLCAKELMAMLDVVPRLSGVVEDEVRAELSMPPAPVGGQNTGDRGKAESISKCIANDEDVTKVMIAIAGGMSATGSKMQKRIAYWEKFKHIWDYDKVAFIRRYAKSDRPLSAFEEDIKRYKEFHKEVSQEESQATMGFINIDYSGLKQDIIGHCLEWQRQLTGLLNEMARADLTALLDAFASTTSKLSAMPQDLKELAEAGKLLKEQVHNLPAVQGLFEPIQAKYKLLEKFEVDVPAEEIAQLESLEAQYDSFKQFLSTTERNLGSCKKKMKVDLEKAAAAFEAEAQGMYDFFKSDAPKSSQTTTTGDAFASLAKFKERLEKNRDTELSLKNGMEVFDQVHEENINMTNVENGIALLEELWGMKGEWDTIFDGYKTGKFAELKTDAMEETAGKFMKKVMMKRKDAGPMPLWSELKQAVDRFRATMPLITDLSNKDLRPRHWQLVMVGSAY